MNTILFSKRFNTWGCIKIQQSQIIRDSPYLIFTLIKLILPHLSRDRNASKIFNFRCTHLIGVYKVCTCMRDSITIYESVESTLGIPRRRQEQWQWQTLPGIKFYPTPASAPTLRPSHNPVKPPAPTTDISGLVLLVHSWVHANIRGV